MSDREDPVFERRDYEDAHFEAADECTAPPRYYKPHERSEKSRGSSGRRKKSPLPALICSLVLAGLLGGFLGAGLMARQMEGKLLNLQSSVNGLSLSLEQQEASLQELQTARLASDDLLATGGTASPGEIYEKATQQVVGIRTEITRTNFFGMTSSGAVSGTGFFISSDGYILTNYHVVEDAYERNLDVQVMVYDGSAYSASIIGVEPANDIAILKIEAEGMTAAAFGNSDVICVGDTIYAVGNPLGELEFSMSTGHVSALDRVITTQESESINMFQIDAAVNEGNSGGPVYNTLGQVIGIVTAKYSSSGVEGLGFAIPVNDARSIAEDLITKGYVTGKAYLGVSLDNRYNSMYAQYYGTPLGAYIAEVTSGSAAEKAGLKAGDILTAIGDYSVTDYSGLRSALRHFSAYEESELTVYRSGAEIRLPVVSVGGSFQSHINLGFSLSAVGI